MRSIQGTPVGMGSIVPGPRALTGTSGWRHQRRPAGWPYDPATWDTSTAPEPETAGSGAEASRERHQRRVRQYQEIRAAEPGLTYRQIAERMQVAPRTVRGYAKELSDKQAADEGRGCGS